MTKEELLACFENYKIQEAEFEQKKADPTSNQFVVKRSESIMKNAFKDLKLGIIEELRKTHEFYQKIQQQNSELMHNANFDIRVVKVISSPGDYDKFSTRFEGGIFPNGYLYLKSVETNQGFTLKSYVSYLSGSIDEHGAGEVSEDERETAIIETLPSLYQGKIGPNGQMFLQVKELDPSFEARQIAYHLAGDPFNRSEKKRKLFLRNRAEMNRLISEMMVQLAKESKK